MKLSDLCQIRLQLIAASVRMDEKNVPCWCAGTNIHDDWCASIRHGLQQLGWAIEDELPLHDVSRVELPHIH